MKQKESEINSYSDTKGVSKPHAQISVVISPHQIKGKSHINICPPTIYEVQPYVHRTSALHIFICGDTLKKTPTVLSSILKCKDASSTHY